MNSSSDMKRSRAAPFLSAGRAAHASAALPGSWHFECSPAMRVRPRMVMIWDCGAGTCMWSWGCWGRKAASRAALAEPALAGRPAGNDLTSFS